MIELNFSYNHSSIDIIDIHVENLKFQ